MSSGGDAGASSSNPPESDSPTSADRLRVLLGPKPAELRPCHAVEGRFAGPHHDGRAPLPRIAEGTQAVLAADGGERPDRPHARQREPEFGLRSAVLVGIAGTPAQPPDGGPGCGRLSRAAGPTKQGLHPGGPFPEPFATRHPEPPDRTAARP